MVRTYYASLTNEKTRAIYGRTKRIKEMGFAVPDSIAAKKSTTISMEEAGKEVCYAMSQWQRFQQVMRDNEADGAFAVP